MVLKFLKFYWFLKQKFRYAFDRWVFISNGRRWAEMLQLKKTSSTKEIKQHTWYNFGVLKAFVNIRSICFILVNQIVSTSREIDSKGPPITPRSIIAQLSMEVLLPSMHGSGYDHTCTINMLVLDINLKLSLRISHFLFFGMLFEFRFYWMFSFYTTII